MSALSVQVPFPVFQDRDGQPLENGYVWIGTANLYPITNAVPVFFDAALTIPAAQPLRTINGYISNSGTPAQVYVNGVNFSILVQDSKGSMVYNFPDGTGISPNASGIEYDPPFTGAVTSGYTVQDKFAQTVSVKDFGAVGNGIADDTAEIQAAIDAFSGGGVVYLSKGTYRVTAQIVVKDYVTLRGEGYATENGTGAGFRGPTCILRDFTGANATVALNGNGSGIDMIDVDGDSKGTGDQVQFWGSRAQIGSVSTRNSGGDGVRIGKTEVGPTSINGNFWKISYLVTCGNAANGLRVDSTNSTTEASYPLGVANAQVGYAELIDARSNGEDGVQVGNSGDNVFANIGSQFNAGCGIRFKTDGVNSGPRCNTVLSNDCEDNVGNDIQIDAASVPAFAPGLYNRIWGNRSAAVNPRIVDNSTGSSIYRWSDAAGQYTWNSRLAVANFDPAKTVVYDYFQLGENVAGTRAYVEAGTTSGGIWELYTKRDGNTIALALSVNSRGILVQHRNYNPQSVQPNVPINVAAGTLVNIDVTSPSAFTINSPTNDGANGQQLTISVKNTSGGAMGTITFGGEYKLSAWTNPANGFSRSISFFYDGTNWIEFSRTTADVPN
jgi:hypothetical protein